MINLAVASTVTIIRKAFSEWLIGMPSKVAAKSLRRSNNEERKDTFYASWDEVPVTQSWRPFFALNQDKALENSLSTHLESIKVTTLDYQRGKIDKGSFRPAMSTAVKKAAVILSESSGKYPEMTPREESKAMTVDVRSYLPSLAPPPIRFRLPTLEEIQDDKAWSKYLHEKRKFFEAAEITENAWTIAYLESKLSRHLYTSASEEQEIREGLKVLDDRILVWSPKKTFIHK